MSARALIQGGGGGLFDIMALGWVLIWGRRLLERGRLFEEMYIFSEVSYWSGRMLNRYIAPLPDKRL